MPCGSQGYQHERLGLRQLRLFSEHVITMLRQCRCWQTTSGYEGPFCEYGKNKGSLPAVAKSKTAKQPKRSAQVVDAAAAAEAEAKVVKKADAAMAVLLVSHIT